MIEDTKRLRACIHSIKSAYSLNKEKVAEDYPALSRILNGNITEIEHGLLKQQKQLAQYYEDKYSVKDADDRTLIEELGLGEREILLLKRNNIFFVDSLKSFISFHSLTELRNCGNKISANILKALDNFEQKTIEE